jgi:hypothetical protein
MLFLYRLALQLGIWDVEKLAEEMSVDQLYGWMAAFQLMPWGDEWLRDAVHMAQTYNSHRAPRAAAMEPADFLPVRQREKSVNELAAKFMGYAAAVNAQAR